MAGELRISDYEGTPNAAIGYAQQGFTSDYGGVTSYYRTDNPVIGNTCMSIFGQGGFIIDATYPNRSYWTGWWRPDGVPTSNRLIVDFQALNTTQASISIDTAYKWRIRNQSGVAVATSTLSYEIGVWYGMVWWADRSSGQQRLELYSLSGELLDVLTGGCGTSEFTRQREGILQGSNDWGCSYDQTAVGTQPIPLTFPDTDPEEHESSVALTGSGTLTASSKKSVNSFLNLSGIGSLISSVKKSSLSWVNLDSEGELNGDLSAAANSFTNLDGEGFLNSETTKNSKVETSLSGEGILDVVTKVNGKTDLALYGAGQLSATRAPKVSIFTNLLGEGYLNASSSQSKSVMVDLSGSGGLTAIGSASVYSEGLLSSTGSLDADSTSSIPIKIDLSGEGELVGMVGTSSSINLNLSGDGLLEFHTAPSVDTICTLVSEGTLAFSNSPLARLDVQLYSSGELKVETTKIDLHTLVNLNGEGDLEVEVDSNNHSSIAVELLGFGNIELVTKPNKFSRIEVHSEGTLELASSLISEIEVFLSGEGLLTGSFLGDQRDITVTASLGENRWSAELILKHRSAQLPDSGWGA